MDEKVAAVFGKKRSAVIARPTPVPTGQVDRDSVRAMALLCDVSLGFTDDDVLRGFAAGVLRARWPGIDVSPQIEVEAASGSFGADDAEAKVLLTPMLNRAMETARLDDPGRYEVVFFSTRIERPPATVWCLAAVPRTAASRQPAERQPASPDVAVRCAKCKKAATVPGDAVRLVCSGCGVTTRFFSCTSCQQHGRIWLAQDQDVWTFTCPGCGVRQQVRVAALEPAQTSRAEPVARIDEITARLAQIDKQLTDMRSKIESAFAASSDAPGAEILIAAVEEKLGRKPAPSTPTPAQIQELEKERDALRAELAQLQQQMTTTPVAGGPSGSTSAAEQPFSCQSCHQAFTWREGRAEVPEEVRDLVFCPHCHAAYDTKRTPAGVSLAPSHLKFDRYLRVVRVVESDAAQARGRYGLEAYGRATAITSVMNWDNVFEPEAATVGYPIVEPLLPTSYDSIKPAPLKADDYRSYYRVVLAGKTGLQLVRFDTLHQHVHTEAVVPAKYERLAIVDLSGPGRWTAFVFVRGQEFEVFERRSFTDNAFLSVCQAAEWDRLMHKLNKIIAKQKLTPLSGEQLRQVREELGIA